MWIWISDFSDVDKLENPKNPNQHPKPDFLGFRISGVNLNYLSDQNC